MSDMLKKPIRPAVISNGIRLGRIEIRIILTDIKRVTMIIEIRTIARRILSSRFSNR